MVFGKNEIFSVEAILNQHGKFAFISYCFWVKRKKIGDFNASSVLSGQIPIFENILRMRGKRKIDYFRDNYIDVDPKSLLAFFINSIWGAEEISNIQGKVIDINDLKVFDVNSHAGECFDGYYVFLVEYPSFDLFLCRDMIGQEDIKVKIPKNIFYDTIKELLDWIRKSTYLVVDSNSRNM